MIVVIADDITGAAELGGVALRYGLQVMVSENVPAGCSADVLVLYTNTRSMQKREAVELMEELTKKASRLHPSLFYKKTDSVLRGHVVAEIKAQLTALKLNKALLVPVNPSLGRIIKNGHYYVNGRLIHETGFATDPEFPVQTPLVKEILGQTSAPVSVVKKGTSLQEGINVGEAETNEDIAEWARSMEKKILAAGGASFFNALLAAKFHVKENTGHQLQMTRPILLVSGTTFKKNVDRIGGYREWVSYMPGEIYVSANIAKDEYEKWASGVVSVIRKYNKAIITIGNDHEKKRDPNETREKIAVIVKLVMEKTNVGELLIEGGSTAYSVISRLGWRSFVPTEELQQGIVRMKVNEKDKRYLTIKPGSYDWPAEWNFN